MAGVTIEEMGLQFVSACMKIYWSSCWYPLLFAVGLLCTLIWGRRRSSRIFIGYTFFLLLTVYNPLVVKYLISKAKFENEYYRFIWILPVIPAVAYYGVRLVTVIRWKWLRPIMAVLVVAALIVLGNPLEGVVTNFAKAENIYKVPDDLRAICDVIHQNQENEAPRAVFDNDLNSIVRQYDASIRLVISRNASLYRAGSTAVGKYNENGSFYKKQKALLDVVEYHIHEEKEGFINALKKTKTDFVIVKTDGGDHEFLTECGCELLAQTGSYYVYKYSG